MADGSDVLRNVQPEGWPPPLGYANGLCTLGRGERVLFIAGQIGWRPDGTFATDDLAEQFGQALDNVLAVVTAAGGEARNIARMTVYVTDLDAYRTGTRAIGHAWRARMGRHFPAMALLGVAGLVEKRAKVEIEATCILPPRGIEMTLPTPTTFRFSLDAGVGTITLDNQRTLNSLTFESYAELRDFLPHLSQDESVRAVVVTGAGKAFCSGGDRNAIIAELMAYDAPKLLAFTRMTGALIRNFRRVRRPVIAAVNGVAVGAGAVIALSCDVRIVAASARFGFVFPQVGLCGADMGAAYLLPRIVGLGRAHEILYSGELIGAEEAHRIGLANRVVPDGSATDVALEFARKLAEGPAFAHAMTKQMIEDEHRMSLDDAIEAEAQAQAICMMHGDFKEAFDAISTKRVPRFAGAPAPKAKGEGR